MATPGFWRERATNRNVRMLRQLAGGDGLFAGSTDPTFGAFLDDLNIAEAGIGEEFAVLVHSEERHAHQRGVVFENPCGHGVRAFVDFRDKNGGAARLGDAEDFAHVAGQVEPPEMGFDRRDQVEGGVWKRELRDRAFADFDAAARDPARVGFLAGGDAGVGKIDPVDPSLSGERGQFADGAAAAAADVEDGEVRRDRDVREAPVGELGMAEIHSPQLEAAEPAGGLLALRLDWRSG
jgi:hypothetical protein